MIEVYLDGEQKKVNPGTVGKIKEQLKIEAKKLVCCLASDKFIQDDEELKQYQAPYRFFTAKFVADQQKNIELLEKQYYEKEQKVEELNSKLRAAIESPQIQKPNIPSVISGPSSIHYQNQEKDQIIENLNNLLQMKEEQLQQCSKEKKSLSDQNLQNQLELKRLQMSQETSSLNSSQASKQLTYKDQQIQKLQGQLQEQNKEQEELQKTIDQNDAKLFDLLQKGSPQVENSYMEKLRQEHINLKKKVEDMELQNKQLIRTNDRVSTDLKNFQEQKQSNDKQTSSDQITLLQSQLDAQRQKNGDLNEQIAKYKKKEQDSFKEFGIKEQSIENFKTLSNNKQKEIDLLNLKLKGILLESQNQKDETSKLLIQMKTQEQLFQDKLNQAKDESNQVMNSITQEKNEQQKQISQLTQKVDDLQTKIQILEAQLKDQLAKGKNQEAEFTQKEIQGTQNQCQELEKIKTNQELLQEKREANLKKLLKIKNIEIKEVADEQKRKIERDQQERDKLRKDAEAEAIKIQNEQERNRANEIARKKEEQRVAALRNKEGKNLQARLLAKLSKESHGIIEVCFLVDSTGSMETYIEQARQCVDGTMASIKKLTNRDCKWACVAYQDYDELKALKGKYRQIDFTEDPKKLTDFMSPAKLHCDGGGDCAEDIKGGMEQAFKLSWNMPFRIIILITDAPSHGRKYHEGCVDDHKDVKLEDTLLKFKQTNTFLIGLQLNKTTGYMFQVFKDFFKSNEAEEFFMTEDLTKIKTEQLWTNIIALISTAAENATQTKNSGTKTKNKQQNKDSGKGGAMEALCKTLSDPTNFDKQPGIALTPCKFNIYNVSLRKENFELKKDRVWEIDVDRDFFEQKEPNSWDCVRTANIFAEGQMKAVYLMKKNTSTSEVYVIKQPLGGMTYKTLKDAKMECRSHMISKAFLSSFIDDLRQAKEEKGSYLVIPNVEYSNFIILSDRPDSFWIAERFYNGEFVKYNNNYGWLSDESNDQNQLAQAFSYYTYYNSNFTAIVNDIQGVGQFWTDPALNTDKGNLDDTDMGKDGISMFLVTYQQKINLGKKYLSLLDISIQPS